MTKIEKKYLTIIKDLENKQKTLFSEDDSKKVLSALQEKLKHEFKLNITFDATIAKAMIRCLEEQFRDYYYEQSFIKTLEFIKKLCQALKKENFIGDRQVKQI